MDLKMLRPTSALDPELRLGNGAFYGGDSHRGAEQPSNQEQVSVQETKVLFEKALLKLSLEQNGSAFSDEQSRTGPRSSQENGSSNRKQAYLDGALKGFEKLVRTASGAGIPLFALHQPVIDAELRRRLAMQSEGSTEEVSDNPEQVPLRGSSHEPCFQSQRGAFHAEDDAKLARCLEGKRYPGGSFPQRGLSGKESGQETSYGEENQGEGNRVAGGFCADGDLQKSGGFRVIGNFRPNGGSRPNGGFQKYGESRSNGGLQADGAFWANGNSQANSASHANRGFHNGGFQSGDLQKNVVNRANADPQVNGDFRNESGSEWESSKGDSPTWASSADWQTKSPSAGTQSVGGRENKRVLENLAKCRLGEEDSGKSDAHLAKVGSNGHGEDDVSGHDDDVSGGSQGDPPSETCVRREGAMRWRGGTSGGDVRGDVITGGGDASGDVSDHGGDVSSEGSFRKRAREEEAGDTGEAGPETPPRPASPSRTSSGDFQRLKGGAGVGGKEEQGGNGSNESTVQSGHKRKQVDSESYESVRQPGDEKRRDLYPARYHTDSRYPGVVRVAVDAREVRDENTGDWKRIADGLRTVYECRFCRKRFLVSQALGGHMNKHRDEKEREKARIMRERGLAIPENSGQEESQKTTPTFQGGSMSSPSTPLNLTDPWSAQDPGQTTPNMRPLPPAALPLPGEEPAKPFQLPKHASPPRAAPPAAAPDLRVGLSYEAGFEAGFGAGLVALARAGLLVPDAALALGWQDLSGWGGRADASVDTVAAVTAAASAVDLAPMEQQLFPVDLPLLGSPPNKRLATAAAAAPSLEKFVLNPRGDATPDLGKFVLERPRDAPAEPPGVDVKPLTLEVPVELQPGVPLGLDPEQGGGFGGKACPPGMTPVWIETLRGPEQVFQMERVQGSFALKSVNGGAPTGNPVFPSNDFGFSGGRPDRRTDPPVGPISAQKARPEAGGAGSGADLSNQGSGFEQYERRRSLASSRNVHPLRPRGGMSGAVRPTVGYVDKHLPQGFRAATPEALSIGITNRFRYSEGTYQGLGESALGRARLSPRSDGPIPLSGTTGTTSSNGTAVSTDEKPYVAHRDDSLGSRGVSPGLSLPPHLSLQREPSDIYQEILQSQPSGFFKELGEASLGGFDEQLRSFAQDHPDWPDYFQGGSVNSGDAFGAPGDKAAS